MAFKDNIFLKTVIFAIKFVACTAGIKIILLCYIIKLIRIHVLGFPQAIEDSAEEKAKFEQYRHERAETLETECETAVSRQSSSVLHSVSPSTLSLPQVQAEKSEDAGFGLRRIATSTRFRPAYRLGPLTEVPQEPGKGPQEPKQQRKAPFPALDQLHRERHLQLQRLRKRRSAVETEVQIFENWRYLQERLDIMFAHDAEYQDSASLNFPLGETEQRDVLATFEGELRREIYEASKGDFEVSWYYKIEVEVGERLLSLMAVLEHTCWVRFERERRRLRCLRVGKGKGKGKGKVTGKAKVNGKADEKSINEEMPEVSEENFIGGEKSKVAGEKTIELSANADRTEDELEENRNDSGYVFQFDEDGDF